MIFVDRFERLRSYGEPEEIYASRRLYMGVIVLIVVRPAVYLRL